MPRFGWLFAAALAATVASGSAVNADPAVRVGARIGLNAASIDAPDDANTSETVESRIGISLGLMARVSVVENVHLEAGVGYGQRGYRRDFNDGFSDVETIRLNGIELPLAVVVDLEAARGIDVRGLGGVSATVLLQASRFDGDDNFKDDVRPLDVGVLVGGGLGVEVAERMVTFDLRYEVGLVDVMKADANTVLADGPVHNRVLTFVVGAVY